MSLYQNIWFEYYEQRRKDGYGALESIKLADEDMKTFVKEFENYTKQRTKR